LLLMAGAYKYARIVLLSFQVPAIAEIEQPLFRSECTTMSSSV